MLGSLNWTLKGQDIEGTDGVTPVASFGGYSVRLPKKPVPEKAGGNLGTFTTLRRSFGWRRGPEGKDGNAVTARRSRSRTFFIMTIMS
jgi:hypothetical protein